MEKELIKSLTENFESFARKSEQGVEFRFARNLQGLLGYTEWREWWQERRLRLASRALRLKIWRDMKRA